MISYYLVLNVVTSVGYGDMFPVTDKERIFFVVMMNVGDVLFALAFGLIAQITMQKSEGDATQSFIERMFETEQLLAEYNVAHSQKQRVEEYFAYAFIQNNSSKFISKADLDGRLPINLVKEIIYYSNKDQLSSMFSTFGSENLIRELSWYLERMIFLPNDFIIEKDTVGEEMYFLVEGSVLIIAGDKHTVLTTLQRGTYFGEIAILFKSKRTSYVQAETFCVINRLRKDDLDEVMKNFP